MIDKNLDKESCAMGILNSKDNIFNRELNVNFDDYFATLLKFNYICNKKDKK